MFLCEAQQPLLQLRMRFDASIGEDVLQRRAALNQSAADQDGAVAFQRLFLRAHDGDALGVRVLDQCIDRLLECRRRGDARVAHLAAFVAIRVLRPRAQRVPQEPIFNAGILERGHQCFLAELRIAAREGRRAHVGHAFDPRALQQIDEAARRVIGMADRIDHAQSRITLPDWPLSMISNPFLKSLTGKWWVRMGERSRPDCSMAIILYQVSNISRP